jgi:hypothetical protein
MKRTIICVALVIAMAAFVPAEETGCTTCGGKTNYTVPSSAVTYEQDSPKGGFTIEKIALSKITVGEVLAVEIILKNDYDTNLSADLKEYIGGADVVDAGGFARSTPKGSPIPPYYKKTVTIAPHSQTTVTYSIRPLYHGTLMLPETEASTSKGIYVSNMLVLEVECNKNRLCETDQDENALTCPQDCPADKPDGLCNPRKDSVCDPDCKSGDPDCGAKTTEAPRRETTTTLADPCGNNACDTPEENHAACPVDCPSGQKDGYCDKIDDGLCDPDCASGEDPDCQGSNSAALIITLLFVVAIILLFAYKKGWLKRED